VLSLRDPDPDRLSPPIPGRLRLLEKRAEDLDGPLQTLAQRFRMLLERDVPLADHLRNRTIVAIEYCDRYVRSPLTTAVLAQLVTALQPAVGASIRVETTRREPKPGKPVRARLQGCIHQDWALLDTQSAILQGVLGDIAHSSVKVHEDLRMVSHNRHLTVTWDDGRRTRLGMDYGTGFIRAMADHPFPFAGTVDEQVKAILDLDIELHVHNGPVPLYVDWID